MFGSVRRFVFRPIPMVMLAGVVVMVYFFR
jgi:hypothetical protein